ncbi:splicing factor, proline- and glutamine-rich-like [Scylla paramamosain]|uniref:splicing factor, proline- and glutamine-rich-like n=1 Tax=Scylla paramamosain TaxID=85552 RepID=UPI003082DD7E
MDAVCERVRRVAVISDDDHIVPDCDDHMSEHHHHHHHYHHHLHHDNAQALPPCPSDPAELDRYLPSLQEGSVQPRRDSASQINDFFNDEGDARDPAACGWAGGGRRGGSSTYVSPLSQRDVFDEDVFIKPEPVTLNVWEDVGPSLRQLEAEAQEVLQPPLVHYPPSPPSWKTPPSPRASCQWRACPPPPRPRPHNSCRRDSPCPPPPHSSPLPPTQPSDSPPPAQWGPLRACACPPRPPPLTTALLLTSTSAGHPRRPTWCPSPPPPRGSAGWGAPPRARRGWEGADPAWRRPPARQPAGGTWGGEILQKK